MTEFEKYFRGFGIGFQLSSKSVITGIDQSENQNPFRRNTYRHEGWLHGFRFADNAFHIIQAFPQDMARFWQAHACGMAAHKVGRFMTHNPHAPRGWQSTGWPGWPGWPGNCDKVNWMGWQLGWIYTQFCLTKMESL